MWTPYFKLLQQTAEQAPTPVRLEAMRGMLAHVPLGLAPAIRARAWEMLQGTSTTTPEAKHIPLSLHFAKTLEQLLPSAEQVYHLDISVLVNGISSEEECIFFLKKLKKSKQY